MGEHSISLGKHDYNNFSFTLESVIAALTDYGLPPTSTYIGLFPLHFYQTCLILFGISCQHYDKSRACFVWPIGSESIRFWETLRIQLVGLVYSKYTIGLPSPALVGYLIKRGITSNLWLSCNQDV